MKTTELGNIIDISKGKKVDQIFPANGLANLSKRYIQIDDLRNDSYIKYTDSKGVEVNANDLIIAWDGANAGTIGHNLEGIIGSTLARLRISDSNFDSKFLAKYLQSKFTYLRSRCTGATIPHINRSVLEKLKIPSPSLPEQKRIADLLDKADSIKQKRKESIALLDEFLRSVFLDMFGDPVKNEKGWDEMKFSEVGKLERGRSKHRPRNAPHLLGGKYPLIQTGEIANSKGYIRSFTQTYSELGLKQSKIWPAGTLCITIAANIANTGILTFDACFPDSVVGFVPNKDKVRIEYVQFWLSFLQSALEDAAPQVAQKNINLEILRKQIIPIPPFNLQTQFARIVEQVEVTKAKMEESLREMDRQFEELMGRLFG